MWVVTGLAMPAFCAARLMARCSVWSYAWCRRLMPVRGSYRKMVLRKDPVPTPAAPGGGVLAIVGEGKLDARDVAPPVTPVHGQRDAELVAQRVQQRAGHHRDAILAALAVPHDDLPLVEVEILYPQRKAFSHAHARAVHEARHEGVRVLHAAEQALRLLRGEHGGQALGTPGAHDIVHPRQLTPRTSRYRNSDRGEGLILRGGSHPAVVGQRREERRHMRRAQLPRVTLAVEENEAPDPVAVGALRAQAVVAEADALADLVQQAGCRGRGCGTVHGRARFVDLKNERGGGALTLGLRGGRIL